MDASLIALIVANLSCFIAGLATGISVQAHRCRERIRNGQ